MALSSPQHLQAPISMPLVLPLLLLLPHLGNAAGLGTGVATATGSSLRTVLRPRAAKRRRSAIEPIVEDASAAGFDVATMSRSPHFVVGASRLRHTALTAREPPTDGEDGEVEGEQLHGDTASDVDETGAGVDGLHEDMDEGNSVEDTADNVLAHADNEEAQSVDASEGGAAGGEAGEDAGNTPAEDSEAAASAAAAEASLETNRRRRGFRESSAAIAARKTNQHAVERLETLIAEETKSQALAKMLGGMKMDLYRTGERLDGIERELEDGVELEEADPEEQLVYPLSTCLRCILILGTLYIVVYTAITVVSLVVDLFSLDPQTRCAHVLSTAGDTVFYAPIVCVLFLGAQFRALQISQGRRGPQDWAEFGMQLSTWSIVVQTAVVLVVPVFTGKVEPSSRRGDSMSRSSDATEDRMMSGFLTLIRYIAVFSLFVGVAIVCAQVVLMDSRSLRVSPEDFWDDPATTEKEFAPPVSCEMLCVMVLIVVFMLAHLAHSAASSCLELARRGAGSVSTNTGEEGKASQLRGKIQALERGLRHCVGAADVAPMACVLFMTARQRALHFDPKTGVQQPWVKVCLYSCTIAVIAHVLLVSVKERYLAADVQGAGGRGAAADNEDGEGLDAIGSTGGQKLAEGSKAGAGMVVLCCLAVVVVYASAFGVCFGIVSMKAPPSAVSTGGMQPPRELPPLTLCVLLLSGFYALLCSCLLITEAVASLTKDGAGRQRITRLLHVFHAGLPTVRICPMLAVLFTGAHLRAVTLRGGQMGSQQCWAQDAMFAASTAVGVELLVSLALAAGARKHTATDEKDTSKSSFAKALLVAVDVLAFCVLYGGALIIVASVISIRPETAACVRRGFIPAMTIPH